MLPSNQSADDDVTGRQAKADESEADVLLRQLRARVDELESELNRSDRNAHQGRSAGQQSRRGAATHTARDTYARSSDRTAFEALQSAYEISRVGRGLVLTSLDQVGSLADFLSIFANEVLDRNQPTPGRRPGDLMQSLPADVLHGFSTALKQTIHNSHNPISTFQQKYQEVKPLRESTEPRVIAASPAGNSSGPAPSAVSVTFSAAIQAVEHDFNSSLVVKKGEKIVAGTVRLCNQNTLVWTPAAPLDAGTYIVRVMQVENHSRHPSIPMRNPFTFVFSVNAAEV
jgi:Bacterial Ig-like domain